ncbi:hypothetical protein [Kineobactrum salinum]|uniref:Uncharacterized protein n=1 Tax=Kineobactrum salinum TaxID=2708301 RepID=A0A6C0TX02_9GAMM|nr:hypothetical protein [Kineobactrum salinum]QIB64053.1 hypothetical protein G3T16_00030 [Kineobactrum salinum]
MPTKHIDERVWREVEKKTVEAVTKTQLGFKDTEILKLLILKGLKTVTEDEIREFKRTGKVMESQK